MSDGALWLNENDPHPAQWCRNLFSGASVDERSIADVQPDDCAPFIRSHFFAGIGGWEYALGLAGWPTDEPVWTGSCPCQPFSIAGRRKGTSDERHLWPEWRRIIAECLPPTIFGEQVASPAGRSWLASVRADLEELGYAVGSADLCSAGVGAPNIRQRLWFGAVRLADTRREGWRQERSDSGRGRERGGPERLDERPGDRHALRGMADTDRRGPSAGREPTETARHWHTAIANGCGDAAGPHDNLWRDADWLLCRDAKWRPVRPGSFPLAHGLPARVVRLRGYGNAINPVLAAEFIRAFRDCVRP